MPIWGATGSFSSSSKTTQHHEPGKKGVQIKLLNGEHLQLYVEVKTKVQELFDQVCFMLGVKETQFFGLCLENEKEYDFLDPKHKLSKYAPKGWKSDSNNVCDEAGRLNSSLTVYFRVQLYVEHVSLIKDDIARHHYYMQLQLNVMAAPVLCREEACFVLASYALQADLGNYSEEINKGRYFEPAKYFPHWVIKRRGENYILRHVPAMHRDQHGTSRALAQRAFIREASMTIEHTMHFYRLKKTKTETSPSIWLGISTRGIQLYKDSGEGKYLLCEYAWGNIKRLLFQKKKFELHVDGVGTGRKITYYTVSEAKSKHMLRLCKISHSFQMQTQTAVDSARKRESTAEKKYRESYVSGDVSWSDMDSSMTTTSFSEMSSNNGLIQRRSVVSNVSSLAMSGVISEDSRAVDNRIGYEVDREGERSHDLGLSTTSIEKIPLDYRPAATAAAVAGSSMRRDPLLSSSSRKMKRHSAAMSTDSSHYADSPASTTNRKGSGRGVAPQLSVLSVVEAVNSKPVAVSREEDRESDIDWESEEEAEDEAESELTLEGTLTQPQREEGVGDTPPIAIIDPQTIQAEIAAKEMSAPFLSALCNDRSLLMMHQAYTHQSLLAETGSNNLIRTSSSQGSESFQEDATSRENDLNNSVTTLVSHSSIESNLHNCFMDLLHTNSSNILNCATSDNFAASMGQLAKHQTLSNLQEMDASIKLTLEISGVNERNKCQTLPPKMNASEQMLLMAGATSVIREEIVSHSAPNLSPGAQVTVASH
ncbi:FERM domain-containing protein 6 [Holothuria leucospilota]|uniref:FERM domain-containing protein 6 n=1 Tax=Holothuria leucospilota TaxID=206669 RepID=A0A9Q1HHP1_HOLLE|nr:FERM domain-containing protein 6 [Holothuria leucospilota]